jgi:hypothetical protein
MPREYLLPTKRNTKGQTSFFPKQKLPVFLSTGTQFCLSGVIQGQQTAIYKSLPAVV